MPNLFALPVLGLSLIGATVLGLHLGESSIGMINPVYFQGPALHPRERGAAIEEPLARAPAQIPYHQLYGWEEGEAQRTFACGDCGTAISAGAPYEAVVPYFGEERHYREADVVDSGLVRAEVRRGVREADIARYAYYVVSETPVEEAEPETVTMVEAETESPETEAPVALY